MFDAFDNSLIKLLIKFSLSKWKAQRVTSILLAIYIFLGNTRYSVEMVGYLNLPGDNVISMKSNFVLGI